MKKEFFKHLLSTYFIVVCFINLAMFILGYMFQRDVQFGYEAYIFPLEYGLISLIPIALTYSNKELSFKQTVFREICKLVGLEVILTVFIFGYSNLSSTDYYLIIGLMISIFMIFVSVHIVTYILDSKQAKEMSEDLKYFQERIK